MITLVVSDCHEDIPALNRLLVHAGPCDRTVFLGDWLDNFSRTPETTQQTLEWMLANVDRPDYEFLFGNHDLQYAFSQVGELRCSGYSSMTNIKFAMHRKIWDRFKLHAWVDGYLLTHAGVHPMWWGEHFDHRCETALSELRANRPHPLIEAGRARGGYQAKGGVTWLDFVYEFESIPDVKQIVGHTHMEEPMWKDGSVCIDCSLKFYAVIEDGKLEIVEVR